MWEQEPSLTKELKLSLTELANLTCQENASVFMRAHNPHRLQKNILRDPANQDRGSVPGRHQQDARLRHQVRLPSTAVPSAQILPLGAAHEPGVAAAAAVGSRATETGN